MSGLTEYEIDLRLVIPWNTYLWPYVGVVSGSGLSETLWTGSIQLRDESDVDWQNIKNFQNLIYRGFERLHTTAEMFVMIIFTSVGRMGIRDYLDI